MIGAYSLIGASQEEVCGGYEVKDGIVGVNTWPAPVLAVTLA